MAKKVILVLCMLVVTTTQLYSSAFGMQMETNSSSPAQASSSHAMHYFDNVEIDAVAENDHDQLIAENDTHCSAMQSNSVQSCDEMTDCAQLQCVSPVDGGLTNYLFDLKSLITARIAVDDLLLTQNRGSLYRPPITH
jgi:hypothetical protein